MATGEAVRIGLALSRVVDSFLGIEQSDSMSTGMWKWIVVVATLAAGAILLDRLLLKMEERGWIYYRKKHASPGTFGGAILSAQSILEPGKQFVLESKQKQRVQEDDKTGADDVDPDRRE